MYVDFFKRKHCNVIQKLNWTTFSQEFLICRVMIRYLLLLESLKTVCILMLPSYRNSKF